MNKGRDNEFVAVSAQAGIVVGDELTMSLAADDRETTKVRVAAIRPVVTDGVVKYELRLAMVERDV